MMKRIERDTGSHISEGKSKFYSGHNVYMANSCRIQIDHDAWCERNWIYKENKVVKD